MQRCFVTNHYLKSRSFINCFGSQLISQISTGYFFFCRFCFLVTSKTSGTHLFHVYLGVSVNARVSSWNLNQCFLHSYFTSPAVHPSHLFVLRDKNRQELTKSWSVLEFLLCVAWQRERDRLTDTETSQSLEVSLHYQTHWPWCGGVAVWLSVSLQPLMGC